jgi:hypothetical protein
MIGDRPFCLSSDRRKIPTLISIIVNLSFTVQNCMRPVNPRPVNPHTGAVRVHYRGAFRPHRPDQVEPAFEPFPEFSQSGVLRTSELAHQTETAEQRNQFPAFCHEQRYESHT